MQTQHLAPDIAEQRLDWFTYRHSTRRDPDLRYPPSGRPQAGIVLDRRASQLLQLLLSEIAQDHTIPFPQTRQAVLKALRRAHDQHHRPTD